MDARTLAARAALSVAAVAVAALLTPAAASAQPPSPAIASPARSALVAPTFVITGRVDAAATQLRAFGATLTTFSILPADAEGATFTAQVTVSYGKRTVSLAASDDGATWSDPVALTVWQLGTVPTADRFVLVDKSDFMLYVVKGRAVIAAYPVAIGMRGTPTPTGTRYLGRPVHAPNGVWGPFRMRLYRRAWVRVAYRVRVNGHMVTRHHKVLKKVGTSYYIHGTNDPDSVGTRASHGCVRLWNSRLRIFRTLTVKYELTVIRG